MADLRALSVQSYLVVTVVSAKELKAADLNGKSDPYVVLQDSSNNYSEYISQKSPVIPKELNPEWNYRFPNKIAFDSDVGIVLRLTIWDKDKIGSDDYLGEAKFKFVPSHNIRHNSKLELTAKLIAGPEHKKIEKITGVVTIKVEVINPQTILEGATFKFYGFSSTEIFGMSGKEQEECVLNNSNPAKYWKGTGRITVVKHFLKFHFEEIHRQTMLSGDRLWVYNGPIKWEVVKGLNVIEIPQSEQWDEPITFEITRLKQTSSNFAQYQIDIKDITIRNEVTLGSWIVDINVNNID